jgi:UDP-N-acetylglucosamine--N-acetylmuramyl-(pentapeptide) pyrophosphoryl-undecaprenol N-acetylglucosamine transferase
VLTGGGTAGHVMPHLALLPEMRRRGWQVTYIGSRGMERDIAARANIPFVTIAAGKLRRYFSWENATDVLKVLWGTLQSVVALARCRPDVVFSKGGFVSVPVALAAFFWRIPVVSHESDMTPGLANRIIVRVARLVLHSFPETGRFLPASKARWSGAPVREELFQGDKARGMRFCGFDASAGEARVLLVTGGSQGAQRINDALMGALPTLLESWHVVHLAGKGKVPAFTHPRYKAFEFVGDELPDLFAMTDLVVSRSGGAIFEFLELGLPMLLIPLVVGSRGDQVVNAEAFETRGWAEVLNERELTPEILANSIARVQERSGAIREAQKNYEGRGAAIRIVDTLERVARGLTS